MSPASSKSRLSSWHGWIACRRNLQDSATAEALRAICEFDLSELQAIVPAARPSGGTDPAPSRPRDAQEPPAPFAPRNAWGAALRARVPPMHDVGKPDRAR